MSPLEVNFHGVFRPKPQVTLGMITTDRPFAGVFQHMSLQVIALPKTPLALRPLTLIGLLSGVSHLM
jgi:hypothetical protein